MSISQKVKGLLSFFGVGVLFYRPNSKVDFTLFDRNMYTPHFKKDKDTRLYSEALTAVGGLDTDNIYKQLRYKNLISMIKFAISQGLEGDFAECGVWRGHSAYIMASLLAEKDVEKTIHIFDSFEGLSDRKKEDESRFDLSSEKQEVEKESFACDLRTVQTNLKKFGNIKYYPGWIPDKFSEVSGQNFSLVHIDVDLYEPIRDSLKFFYERLVTGGIIVLDDVGMTQFQGAERAFNEFVASNPVSFYYITPAGAALIIK